MLFPGLEVVVRADGVFRPAEGGVEVRALLGDVRDVGVEDGLVAGALLGLGVHGVSCQESAK